MENKHVLIVEHNQNKLSFINENVADRAKRLTIGGIFTEFNIENRNKRFYTAENFIPVMNNTLLAKKALLGVVYGELDHPEGFDISGQRASHVIESLVHNQAENRVDGSITILTTPNGKIIRSILEDGFPVFVSSRASGMTGPNNQVALKELYTYDGVLDPGFANTRQSQIYESLGYDKNRIVSINESLGFNDDINTPYRIYDLSETFDVHSLALDNKNKEQKTYNDFKNMENTMEKELALIEARLIESINSKMTSIEDIKALTEKYEQTIEQLETMKKYMEFFKTKYNGLVKEHKKLKTEISENTEYFNHLSGGLKNITESISDIQNENKVIASFAEQIAKEADKSIKENKAEIEITQKFAEQIAESANKSINKNKAEIEVTQKFAEQIAESTVSEFNTTHLFIEQIAEGTKSEFEVTNKFVEYVAEHTKDGNEFAEYIAEKLNANNKFTEYTAQEIKVTQGLLEHIAGEYKQDNYFISYIADKVEGIKNYIKESSNGRVNESADGEEMEDIDTYLGLDEEERLLNSIENNVEIEEEPNEFTEPVEDIDSEIEEEEPVVLDQEEVDNTDATLLPEEDAVIDEPELSGDEPELSGDESLETSMLSALVNILGTDDTGIVMEITPDNKLIIQKSGSDETIEASQDEVMILGDDNIVESVSNVLNSVKKTKALANRQPHFFTFLNEQEKTNFKLLDTTIQNEIITVMESSVYLSEEDVLRIIGETINKDTLTYEQKLINGMPSRLSSAWNELPQNIKEGYIAESTFFNFVTTADLQSYWNTREFAKRLDNGVELINETLSTNSDEEFSQEFIDAITKENKVNRILG